VQQLHYYEKFEIGTVRVTPFAGDQCLECCNRIVPEDRSKIDATAGSDSIVPAAKAVTGLRKKGILSVLVSNVDVVTKALYKYSTFSASASVNLRA
jgi:hypothetical protein